MSTGVKFEDLLLFEDSKNRSIIEQILQNDSPIEQKKTDLLFFMEQAIEQMTNFAFWNSFNSSQQELILNSIKNLYMNTEISLNNEPLEVKQNVTVSVEKLLESPLVDRFKEIVSEMAETYERKNHDYGNSFSESVDKYGYIAGLVRMSDKWNRLNSLLLNGGQKVNDESVVDTLTDLACYSIMLRMEFERNQK